MIRSSTHAEVLGWNISLGPNGRLQLSMDTDFFENPLQVVLDRIPADEELLRYIIVGCTLRKEREDLLFPL